MPILLFVASRRATEPVGPGTTPTNTPIPTQALSVVSTTPADGAKNIILNQQITIIFNRVFTQDEISFSIAPPISTSQQIKNNQLLVTPQQNFQQGTLYTYALKYASETTLPKTYSFTTVGPTQPYLPDTRPSGAAEQNNAFLIQNHPDVFLSNQTPYSASNFSVSSDFTQTPTGHFHFTVSLIGNSQDAKNAFIQWALSLGLTNEQIQQLDITYQ